MRVRATRLDKPINLAQYLAARELGPTGVRVTEHRKRVFSPQVCLAHYMGAGEWIAPPVWD